MKATKKYIGFLLGVFALAACDSIDYPDRFVQTSGVPTIDFIRYADKDVIITQASMEEVICIVGDNLTSVHDLYFNDQPAILNSSYMTAKTLIVTVPKTAPVEQTDKIYFYNKDGQYTTYDFKVLAPAPKIERMSNEWAAVGEKVTITGNYFIEPMTVQFPGAEATELSNVTATSFDVVVPEGAQPGKVKVTTASGTAQSIFMYKDTRGMLFNFDNDPHPTNHGWHAMVIETDETAINGNFLRLGNTAGLDEEGGWNDGEYSFEYWPGDWDDPVSYADSPRLTDFVDFTNWANMALKFELYIPSATPWMSGAMQLIIGGVDVVTDGAEGAIDIYGNVTAGANNKFISGDGVPQAPRALWIPWKETGSYDTGDKWVTITIPYTDFNKMSDGTANSAEIKPDSFTSLTIFVWAGGVTGTACNPIMKIDNIRAVPIK